MGCLSSSTFGLASRFVHLAGRVAREREILLVSRTQRRLAFLNSPVAGNRENLPARGYRQRDGRHFVKVKNRKKNERVAFRRVAFRQGQFSRQIVQAVRQHVLPVLCEMIFVTGDQSPRLHALEVRSREWQVITQREKDDQQ